MSLKNISKYTFPVIFLLYCLWVARGVFPLNCYEYDSMNIARASSIIASEGWSSLGTVGYGYWMQPLTYVVLVLLNMALPTAGAVEIYCVLTAVSALVLTLVTVTLIHRLTGIGRITALGALILIPETYQIAMYPNSMAPALMCAMCGMLAAHRRRMWLCGALLCIGALLRLDVAIFYPVLPFVMRAAGYTWRRACIGTAWCALAVAVTILPVYHLLGASVSETMDVYQDWASSKLSFIMRFMALFGCFGPVSLPLTALGLWRMWQGRSWMALCIVMVGCVSVSASMIMFGNAPKHYAPLFLSIGMAAGVGLHSLLRSYRHPASATALTLIVLLMVFGIYIPPRYTAVWHTEADTSNLPGVRLTPGDDDSMGIRLGTGKDYRTPDEVITTCGYLWYPALIHNIKSDTDRRVQSLLRVREQFPHATVIYTTWEGEHRLLLLNLDNISPYNTREWLVHRDEDAQAKIDRLIKKIIEYATEHPHTIIVQTEPIYHGQDWTLHCLEERGVLRQIEPHIYLVVTQ